MHNAIFKTDKQQGPTVEDMELSAQCYVAAWMGEGLWGEWIHVYVHQWLSPFAVHLKLSQHC